MEDNREPSILDYLKSKLPGQVRFEIPETEQPSLFKGEKQTPATLVVRKDLKAKADLPWQLMLGFLTALLAQFSLERRIGGSWAAGAMLYFISAALIIFYLEKFTKDETILRQGTASLISLKFNLFAGLLSILLAVISFIIFKGGLFNPLNVTTWILSILAMLFAFGFFEGGWTKLQEQIRDFARRGKSFHITPFLLLALVAVGISLWFRFYLLTDLPREMVSDHAEKLLDVYDVMKGHFAVFFPRNTGREFFQFYWTAWIAGLFGTGVSYLSLKLGTVILGVLTLPFVYLLGKELWNRRVGVIALFLCGIAFWPNSISRFALRFTLYPFFFAPTLYFLLLGLRKGDNRFFALSGLFLGLGLHGYTPFRIVPLVVLLALLIFFIVKRQRVDSKTVINGLFIIVIISALVLLPLLRYSVDHPDQVWFRTLSRVGDSERQIEGSVILIFLTNLWRALTMYFWDNGEVWVISLPHRPALDFVTGALLFLGLIFIIHRFIKHRRWTDLFLPFSIPFLMLPSIMSIAFPNENPSLNRPAGAMIPVFLIAAYALDWIYTALRKQSTNGLKIGATIIVGLTLLIAGLNNYDLYFNQYRTQFDRGAWNTSEIGADVKGFLQTAGTPDSVFLVGYPHWVDSRLVSIVAGTPWKDYGVMKENLNLTFEAASPKLYILNIQDTETTDLLKATYPEGKLQLHQSKSEGRDYLTFYVP
ncbi:MAG TPA: glycosyltransferase family 39 protein [Bellilinea sp.]|nr:glycosyltransferase family 39 protein [Bellilinea sp.]